MFRRIKPKHLKQRLTILKKQNDYLSNQLKIEMKIVSSFLFLFKKDY